MMIHIKPVRNSAIELLRIIAMFIIIIHHFGVHGILHVLDNGISKEIILNNMFAWQLHFTQIVAWGGTLGNAIFILITGYFMINKIVRTKKIILLVFNMLFYSWLILICVYIVMPELLTSAKIIKLILPILFGENWFVTCYIQFFCFVPYLNKFLTALDKKKYLAFLLSIFLFFSLLPAVKIITYFNSAGVVFFALIYSIGGYLRLYFKDNINNKYHKTYCKICAFFLLVLVTSIIFFEMIGVYLNEDFFIRNAWHFVNTLSIPLAVAIFLAFATTKPFFNKYVNIVACTMLGVYLIHDNSLMRYVIWDYIFPNLDYISSSWYVVFYIIKVVAIFIVCSGIDLLRKRYIEPQMVRFIDRKFDVVNEYVKTKMNNVITLLDR